MLSAFNAQTVIQHLVELEHLKLIFPYPLYLLELWLWFFLFKSVSIESILFIS